MENVTSTVFLALQTNDESRPIIEAIERDNPHATFNHSPAMVKIDAPGKLVVKRETIEEITGICLAENKASVKVMERCGFAKQYEGLGPYQGQQREICRFVFVATPRS